MIDGHEECRSELDRMKREHEEEVKRLQKRIDDLERQVEFWRPKQCEDGP